MRKFVAWLFALTLGWSAVASAEARLEIGYMPIIPVAQSFLILEGDALARAGVTDVDTVQFQNGPAMVQALLAGQLDVAFVGIGPAMVARAKGADVKVVASNIVEQISILALGELAPYFERGDAATAFARFAEDQGRKPVLSTFPRGSVPETVLQYWLREQLGVAPDSVEIIYQGAAQVQQSLMTGAVDGAAILEPVVSVVTERMPAARVVVSGAALFPDQPGAVLLVRERLIEQQPELVRALVAAHVEATETLREQPAEAAPVVGRYVGGGRLPVAIVERAIRNSRENFRADPNSIIEGTRRMRDFQAELGTLKVDVDLEALFDTRFYDELAGAR
ncbi:ABC transporter substrate-binding protein [Alkalilimnicola sp. S0819]|uniref:ABC transporter substrate-binding protein n=1 Tax=Alkalilimnicola sp. S0819 TaxID=2613922 RepID=UPI001261E5BA|nr:ABC transporter substrate-binding protein [Alkalilimnicola sp. S0819]KAB7623902.1 ABC transporter substrate-binding protein [Alkalilimnicola sp. S0819]MPQ16497.1 ABC transporter substrate-binding protein [Alkalilimnicola sp. S0819]